MTAFCLLAVAAAHGGCSSDADPSRRDAVPTTSGAGSVTAEPADEAAYIYDQERVHTFDVELSAADLERVDREPAAEQYVPARLRFEGQSYEVGYRYKGSVGAFRPPCTSEFDGGPKGPGRCSVKLSFNWNSRDGEFYGLRKLVFHAMNNDRSMLRERLGYAMFRAMGVPASRATHAILRVNGRADVYALVEEVDGRFTRSRFTEGGEGNLYKEIWPIHDDAAAYVAALETNEDQQPSVDRMLRFVDAVQEGAGAMAAWIDRELTTSYMAVDRVIMNDDGAFHFYCHPRGVGSNPTLPANHNYFWYEAASADRLWIIPWDLDHSLRESTILPHIATDWRAVPNPASCTACTGAGSFGGLDGPPPGCDRVIRHFQSWQASYEQQVDAFVAGPFERTAVLDKLEAWTLQLAAAGFPVDQGALEELIAVLDRARANRGFRY